MTPRRILLLVAGLLVFGAVYALYARLFGWLDGLPVLPARLLAAADGSFRPPPRATSPTIELLKAAFGEASPETESALYPTQLEFRGGDGETSLVVAAGRPPGNPGSKRVTLVPFSAAVFSKPRPAHLRQTGEVTEVSTFHSDKAVLEFDRVINTPTDMNTAKLVRLELVSDPDQTLPDPRRGLVHITNNQRSADPNRHLVLRTVGPVFYRDPKMLPPGTQPPLGPDVWTDAPVEIVDRGNLPRNPGTPAAAAPAAGAEVRLPEAVAAVLDGHRLPPPTVTAVGMRIYMEPDKPPEPKTRPPAGEKKMNDGLGGVRRVELLERVLMNLWVEGGQGLVGSGGKAAAAPVPPALIGVVGGLAPAHTAAREQARSLLQVETRGPFAYDTATSLARFDVLPQADPNLPNDVRVTKVPPRPGVQTLFSQVLELEFNGSPTGGPPAPRPGPPAAKEGPPPPAGAKFKRLHAWTYTPGRFVTVSSDADHLEAYGQDLIHDQAAGKTFLTGAPLIANSQRNVLTAGGPKQPAVLILEPAPETDPVRLADPNRERKTQATVRGPGRVELYDAAAKQATTTASWRTSLVQTKEKVNDAEVDLFTFTDGAKFEDTKADFWLKGNVLKLWLGPGGAGGVSPPASEPAGAQAARGKPHRLQAIGAVTGHSADLDIEQADYLNTLFRDVTPPPPPAGPLPPESPDAKEPGEPAAPPKEPRDPAAPPPPAGPAMPAGPVAPGEPAPKEPEKPKPPTKLRARTIDTWVVRYPVPVPPAPAGGAGGDSPPAPGAQGGGTKYQLEKAKCEGMVIVHQDPADPTKPRGTDIFGSLMWIESTPDGSVMTVFGWDDRPGEVHNEGTSLVGPKVVLDQLHNLAVVEGRGSLVMPASSDFAGAELKQPGVVVVDFRDAMRFEGAKKTAEFFGRVNAKQGESWVTCHTMRVVFDRPVYFTQANRPAAAPKPAPQPGAPAAKADDDKPKIDVIFCYPSPADAAETAKDKQVAFKQVERDPDTGREIRRQTLVAQELTLRAQFRDEGRGEPYRLLIAEGPGVVRGWQPGSKDDDPAGQAAAPKPAGDPGNAPPAETEMKLTVVNFSGRMTGKDKGRAYQEATFLDPVDVIHVPTDDPGLAVDRHKLPPKAVFLSCSEKLVTWTYRKPAEAGKPKEPAQQHMEAYGNAYLQSEKYDGWGEVITHDGKTIVFDDGSGFGRRGPLVPARIKSRFDGDDQSGRQIIFDRPTNHYHAIDSIGGTITSKPSAPPAKKDAAPKRANPPKK